MMDFYFCWLLGVDVGLAQLWLMHTRLRTIYSSSSKLYKALLGGWINSIDTKTQRETVWWTVVKAERVLITRRPTNKANDELALLSAAARPLFILSFNTRKSYLNIYRQTHTRYIYRGLDSESCKQQSLVFRSTVFSCFFGDVNQANKTAKDSVNYTHQQDQI